MHLVSFRAADDLPSSDTGRLLVRACLDVRLDSVDEAGRLLLWVLSLVFCMTNVGLCLPTWDVKFDVIFFLVSTLSHFNLSQTYDTRV